MQESAQGTVRRTGTVVAIHVAADDGAPQTAVETATLVTDKGIDGDRYFGHSAYRNVTLVSENAVESACADIGVGYVAGSTRRNVTVRGLDVMTLLGREFRLGGARLLGTRPCEPCAVMEGSVGAGARDALVNRAGIRAQVVEGGTVGVGDTLEPL